MHPMKRRLIVAGIVIVLVGLAWIGLRQANHSDFKIDAEALAREFAPVQVTYKVRGTAKTVDITVQTASGTSQQNELDVPLTRKSDHGEGLQVSMQRGSFVYLSAQNQGAYGTIECVIEGSDGTEISRNSSSGGYAIATCSGKAR